MGDILFDLGKGDGHGHGLPRSWKAQKKTRTARKYVQRLSEYIFV